MREIKFRAWDGSRMVNVNQLDLYSSNSFRVNDDVESHLDDWPLMQYTGLKDKNGKEIYEGDVMSTGHGWSNYTVVFEDGSFCFGNDQPNGADRLSQDRVGRLEVIGNIYETPTP